jgi:hypothetical protein
MLNVKPANLGRWHRVRRALPTKRCLLPTQHKLAATRPMRESIACSRLLNGSKTFEDIYERRWRQTASGVFFALYISFGQRTIKKSHIETTPACKADIKTHLATKNARR